MSFSFPFPPSSPDQPAHLRRLWPLVLLAVGLNGLWMLMPGPRKAGPSTAARVSTPADDTPQLLRLGRAEQADSRIPGLPLSVLPPPPPALLPKGAAPLPAQPAVEPSPALLPLPAQLPEAASALRMALRLAPALALASPEREAIAALQRRQWWLTASQEALAQALWQRAKPLAPLPDGLGKLPDDTELRRMPEGSVAWLGAGDWHGRSLVGRQAVLLIWRQGDQPDGQLWLLRLPLAEPEAARKTLTSS